MTISKELAAALAESRRKIEQKRVKVRPFVRGRPRGRPIKHSGTYYTRSVLITDRLMLKIRKNRLPGEPLGATLERLVNSNSNIIAEDRKKLQAAFEQYDPLSKPVLNDDEHFKTVWNLIDSQ